LPRQHPTADWLSKGGSYFTRRVIEETWKNGWQVRYWLQSLEDSCAEFAAAGFLIERLVEPRPALTGQAVNPEDFDRLRREPGFIAFRLVPRPAAASSG